MCVPAFLVSIVICLPAIIFIIMDIVLISKLHQMSVATIDRQGTSQKRLQVKFCHVANLSVQTNSDIENCLCKRCYVCEVYFFKKMYSSTYILYVSWNDSVYGCVLIREKGVGWNLSVFLPGGICKNRRSAQKMLARVSAVGIKAGIKCLKIYLASGTERSIDYITNEIQFYCQNGFGITRTHYCEDTHIFKSRLRKDL